MEQNLVAGPEAAEVAKCAEMVSAEAPFAWDPQRLQYLQREGNPVAQVGVENSVVEVTRIPDAENPQSSAPQNIDAHLAADPDGTFADAGQPSVHANYMEDCNVAGIQARLVRAE